MENSIFTKLKKKMSQPTAMDLYVFCVQVTSFLSAGVPLNSALDALAPQQKNKELGAILKVIVTDMEDGLSAAEAFSKHAVFPAIFAPTIESGEKASGLDLIFKKLADQMWLQTTLYSKINSALLTPKIAGFLMAGLITGFAKVMVPKYEEMFNEANIKMPWIMDIFVKTVNGFFEYFFLWLLLAYGLYRGFKEYFVRHPVLTGKIKLKLPVYKTLHYSLINYQFASNLALMLNSGLNVVLATKQTAKVVSNSLFQMEIERAGELIQTGDSVREAMAEADEAKVIDPLVLSFIDSGEKTGNLVEMLEKAADIHKTLLDATVDKVSTKITLVVILPMGLVMVGMYMMSLVPMLSYFDQLVK